MKKSPVRYFLIAIALLIIDQFTKYLITQQVSPFEAIQVLPFFNIVYVENVGSAFGMFRSLGNVFFITIAALAIVVVSVLILKGKDDRLSLALILGGAAGNLADRLIYGYVIDFVDLYVGSYHWPAFNVADSALSIGVALLFLKTLLHVHRKE